MTPAQLKSLRAQLGWSQARLAERVGVDQATISRWEAGTVPISQLAANFLKTLASRPAV
jgi:transcriptional regulator with XRE-family HTH domain